MSTTVPINRDLLQALQMRASANRAALARRQADARALATAKAQSAAKYGR
jgi:hypothetical protein